MCTVGVTCERAVRCRFASFHAQNAQPEAKGTQTCTSHVITDNRERSPTFKVTFFWHHCAALRPCHMKQRSIIKNYARKNYARKNDDFRGKNRRLQRFICGTAINKHLWAKYEPGNGVRGKKKYREDVIGVSHTRTITRHEHDSLLSGSEARVGVSWKATTRHLVVHGVGLPLHLRLLVTGVGLPVEVLLRHVVVECARRRVLRGRLAESSSLRDFSPNRGDDGQRALRCA